MFFVMGFLFMQAFAAHAQDNFADTCRLLAKADFSLPHLNIELDVQEITQQTALFPGHINIVNACAKALDSFSTDNSDYESPLAIAAELCEKNDNPNCPQEKLHFYMNQPQSSMSLIHIRSDLKPERGEKHDDYWLFLLDLPALSDHLFWAMVSRKSGLVYNYGFN